MTTASPRRFLAHLYQDGPHNPFPGIKALERRLGHALPYQYGSNEGLDMPHHTLGGALGTALADLSRSYADADAWQLRQQMAERLGVAYENLLVDAGADSLLALVMRATVCAGERVITSAGTYPTLAYFARGLGAEVIEVPYSERFATADDASSSRLAPDLAALLAAARQHDARVVYLANPDNPSGHLHSDADVRALRDALPESCSLLLDEAYHDFRPDAAHADHAPMARTFRLRTFSKAYGLAGLRLGFMIAEPDDVVMLTKVRIHFAVSAPAMAAGELLLAHPEEAAAHVAGVIDCRDRLAEHLRSLGAEVLPSATNFLCVRLKSAELAAQVQQQLMAQGVLITRSPHPSLGHILRISTLEDSLVPGRLARLEQAIAEERRS
ncbi:MULTISPECIES: histidinol-phosphate transaminase [unclassified Cobetia]|uniref:pyridoxal phosphate-dependent aminotransferase n=1 Tax=unclassified Cobetia TaxID=2609414 RepID=UPI0020968EB7|nr:MULTISPECIES: aminotransferase class I/II-fold pyridoxal phosphate-dependent enzyme [unclassified Cobetia]MCO7232822.1 aminotransferase class I/II-fold pyridoxal phosphate-dependent enzyme [Cobetia sp. Dlab-2-AX]MCO7236190.1 aminotransferase class I/II-fold pyridoxal phosphate-dependent enzyme [Cobetia sp. Dlab-2-U]